MQKCAITNFLDSVIHSSSAIQQRDYIDKTFFSASD